MVICTLNGTYGTRIEHYYNSGRQTPQYLSSSTPNLGVGMINMVTVVGNRVNVTFSRENMISVPNYYNLSTTAYIIAARGDYTSSGGETEK